MKVENKNPGDLLSEVQVLTFMWDYINMEFLVGLAQTQRQYDSIWVVVDG